MCPTCGGDIPGSKSPGIGQIGADEREVLECVPSYFKRVLPVRPKKSCRACGGTLVPVLDPGKGNTKTGRLGAAVRDKRRFGSAAPLAAFYRYSPDRKAEHARALLAGYRGLTEVACWVHARRKIYDVQSETGSPGAHEALERIARQHLGLVQGGRAEKTVTPAKRRGGVDEGRPTATCLLDHPDCLHDFGGGEVCMLSAASFVPTPRPCIAPRDNPRPAV